MYCAINSKVSVAQGVENAGKVLVVGKDGEISLSSVSGKTLYTGSINDLFSFTNNAYIEVLKDFDIEYIYCNNWSIYSKRVSISKSKYLDSAMVGGKYNLNLGICEPVNIFSMPQNAEGSYISISANLNSITVVVSYDSSTGSMRSTQLTSDIVDVNDNGRYFFYRIYV